MVLIMAVRASEHTLLQFFLDNRPACVREHPSDAFVFVLWFPVMELKYGSVLSVVLLWAEETSVTEKTHGF